MTLEDARTRLGAVAAKVHDDEAAHLLEDAFWKDVLQEIACGTLPLEQVRELANTALNTTLLGFSRWYA